jgi:hypothetical protein
MPLFEFQLAQSNGSIESRYSDQPVSVGQELKLGSHRVIVVGEAGRPLSPLADSAFICRRLRGGARLLPGAQGRRWRRAA